MPLLCVLRHPPVSETGVCHGQCDLPLAVPARDAANEVLDALMWRQEPLRLDKVWTSPWTQTRSVAEILAGELGAELREDARLSEFSFGDWEGRPFVDIQAEHPEQFQMWMQNWWLEGAPGGETIDQFLARTRAWFDEWQSRGENAMIVTHGGVVRALRSHAEGRALEDLLAEPVEHMELEFLKLPV